ARATPAAQARFEDLALTGTGLLRWIAVEALGRLGRNTRACGVLREAFRRATPHEERLILEVLPRCAEKPEDVAWTLDLPVRAGQEAGLSHCAAVLVSMSLAKNTAPPPAALDRLVQLLRDALHHIQTWAFDPEPIIEALLRHLRTDNPGHRELAVLLA